MEDKHDIQAKVVSIVAAQLGIDEAKVEIQHKLVADQAAVSIDRVLILVALENAFEIEINDAEAEKFVTVSDIVDCVNRHLHPANIQERKAKA